ncbi:secretory pathway Sec39 family protein [Aspergillus saccharolyticus JOP 1030-1]|uniref:Secretory pathway Sec39 n=1 Tax=Aspergillus saccharolyticus JOP 1030-1 TaxID=1450539 RepID=A0A318Z9U4_9EURO|nr:secretory pathway Sec39 [Aspergillus saccharolyticus JOP 1030-1]PYH43197.1 secretory pathway Sec39 [Aspergillus saccharolyticus JOP 1030-1]
MASPSRISGAHAILLSIHLCVSGDVSSLPQLQAQYSRWLPTERLLRIILTFLPESCPPQTYAPIVESLVDAGHINATTAEIDTSAVSHLTDTIAKKRVRKVRLLPLRHPNDEDTDDSTDLLTQFLIHRAHRIDSETALQSLILDLLVPFYPRSPILRTWLISSLLPLLRLNYEYYPSQDETFSLEILESMDNSIAINVLLSMTGDTKTSMDLVQNLRGLVGAWMYGSNRTKRRKLNEAAQRNTLALPEDDITPKTNAGVGWQQVNEWLLARSLVDHESAVNAFTNWDGPEDVDLGGYAEEDPSLTGDELKDLRMRYGQTGLAVVYANADVSAAALEGSIKVLARIASFLDLEQSLLLKTDDAELPSVVYDSEQISSTSRISLMQNALLTTTNPLTRPSASSISFLSAVCVSLQVLSELGHPMPCRTAANLCLHNNLDTQLLEMRTVVQSVVRQSKAGRDWGKVRQQLLWLRDWDAQHTSQEDNFRPAYHGIFWRVDREVIEAEILKALLEVREYQLAVDIYLGSNSTLSSLKVEEAVKETIYTAYDNASNGNRTRGGMKRAYEILQAFQPHFPDSLALKQINALIAATHSLSFYSLTLQHGVPFQPVSIRVHSDPLSLVEKVLEQNPKSYTKVDDLLAIGRNLVAAGFSPQLSDHHESSISESLSEKDATLTAERRIMSLAINSALASHDFGTAYSYILTRLTPTSSPKTPDTTVTDDITWRTVYAAGRYRPPPSNNSTPPSTQSQITHLTQRMELLSLAIILVPSDHPDPLPEILGAWRRCDEELSNLRTQESLEEDIWDTKGDLTSSLTMHSLPGGFGPADSSEQDALETRQHHARRARAHASHHRLNHEEAPMGLFEVARGAALALQKNAFPLRAAASATSKTASPASSFPQPHHNGFTPSAAASSSHTRTDSAVSAENYEPGGTPSDRVRKRDVVSNMVTDGLVSGLGWVLGAQPVNRS